MQHLHDVENHVQADQVGKLERSHRMTHSELHYLIDGFHIGHAFLEGEDGFVDHGDQDAVADKSGGILDEDGCFPERPCESHGGFQCGRAGGFALDDFNQLHQRDRVEEVQADHPVRVVDGFSDAGDAD